VPIPKSVFGNFVVDKVALPQLSSAVGTFQVTSTAVSAVVLVTLAGQL
jgi:hypothetical protein